MPRLSVLLLKLLKHSGIDRQRALCKGNVSVFISHFHGTLYEDIHETVLSPGAYLCQSLVSYYISVFCFRSVTLPGSNLVHVCVYKGLHKNKQGCIKSDLIYTPILKNKIWNIIGCRHLSNINVLMSDYAKSDCAIHVVAMALLWLQVAFIHKLIAPPGVHMWLIHRQNKSFSLICNPFESASSTSLFIDAYAAMLQ